MDLVFFELMGSDPQTLMGPLAGALTAISLGAVYMGALTYIGNAPNLMVYAIAQDRGIKMPSFFAYLFWAALVLEPIFVLLTVLPISPLLKADWKFAAKNRLSLASLPFAFVKPRVALGRVDRCLGDASVAKGEAHGKRPPKVKKNDCWAG